MAVGGPRRAPRGGSATCSRLHPRSQGRVEAGVRRARVFEGGGLVVARLWLHTNSDQLESGEPPAAKRQTAFTPAGQSALCNQPEFHLKASP